MNQNQSIKQRLDELLCDNDYYQADFLRKTAFIDKFNIDIDKMLDLTIRVDLTNTEIVGTKVSAETEITQFISVNNDDNNPLKIELGHILPALVYEILRQISLIKYGFDVFNFIRLGIIKSTGEHINILAIDIKNDAVICTKENDNHENLEYINIYDVSVRDFQQN